jgi:serine/threonine protein kinase
MRDLVGHRLGDFEIVRELGRGGMGVVYEARQVSLNRKVALKVLSGGLGLTSQAVLRFRREAEAAAKLHHTNIVPVYATGEQDGTHFYAMELIDGPSLDRVIRQMRAGAHSDDPPLTTSGERGGLAPTGPYLEGASDTSSTACLNWSSLGSGSGYFDTVARLVAEVADALAYAHQQGVIHRDIKPSNLLLSPASRLSINDFGLARVLEQPGMTMTGEFVGTPAYMSPEQIAVGRIPLDHRTDIYSLGATLYELLTLQPPFTSKQRDQLLAQIVQKEPQPPRKIQNKVPVDLETICLKCLEKDPDRRYQSAKELADDLRRHLNRFAIRARRVGPLTRLKKWVKRNPALSAAGLALLLALVTAGLFAWRAHESEQQRQADEHKREEEALAERRRAAIERGMTAALATDLDAAEKAVADAELLGASAGEIRLLRGFIALYSGQIAKAVAHLEQAVQLMPDSVAARSLLSFAYATAFDWPAAQRALKEAAALTPLTPEDKLFLGQAIGLLRPADGLPLMDQALAERRSAIGHVLRATSQMLLARSTGAVADADAAVVDAELAKRLLPGNPFSLFVAADAQMAAAVAFRKAGRPDKWNEHLAAAGREADALARFPENYSAVVTRYMVAMARAGLDGRVDMLAELRRARANSPRQAMAFYEGYDLFCLGRDAEAWDLAKGFPDYLQTGRLRFLVALGRRDGRADARRACEAMVGPGRRTDYRLDFATLLFAVASPHEVAALARDLRASDDQFPYRLYSRADQAAILAFLEGTASEADLLGRPVSNEHERCRRHYVIAWKRLGVGDRDGARAAFQKAYEVMQFSTDWWISRAVLIRMKDPDWPQAIPKK